MKVLRLGTYFAPEVTAASHLVDDLNEEMAHNKIYCKWIVPMPSRGIDKYTRNVYKRKKNEELYDGYISVFRFSMIKEGRNIIRKTLKYFLSNMAEYYIGSREENIDLVFSSSTPPTQGFLSARVARKLSKKYGKKVPFIYNLQDIFPDSLVHTGLIKKDGILWKIGRKIEDYTYKNADKIIVISDGFKQNIMKKGVPENKIEIISNWIDLNAVHPVEREKNKLLTEFGLDSNKFIVVYAGNFGAAQGADIILKVAKELQGRKDIHFVLFGGGVYFDEAKREAEDLENVFIHELMPKDRISEVYSLGDVALITCKKNAGKAGMPSKTWSIMACNTPIIASFDIESDLSDVLRRSGAGECVKPENVTELVNAILNMKNRGICSNNLREYVKANASKETCVSRYVSIISNVENERK